MLVTPDFSCLANAGMLSCWRPCASTNSCAPSRISSRLSDPRARRVARPLEVAMALVPLLRFGARSAALLVSVRPFAATIFYGIALGSGSGTLPQAVPHRRWQNPHYLRFLFQRSPFADRSPPPDDGCCWLRYGLPCT